MGQGSNGGGLGRRRGRAWRLHALRMGWYMNRCKRKAKHKGGQGR